MAMGENGIIEVDAHLMEGLTLRFIDRHAKTQSNRYLTTAEYESESSRDRRYRIQWDDEWGALWLAT